MFAAIPSADDVVLVSLLAVILAEEPVVPEHMRSMPSGGGSTVARPAAGMGVDARPVRDFRDSSDGGHRAGGPPHDRGAHR